MRKHLPFFHPITQRYRSVYPTFRVNKWKQNRWKHLLIFSEQVLKIEKKYWRYVIMNGMRILWLLLIYVFSCLKQQYGKVRRTFFSSYYSFFSHDRTATSGPRPPLYRGFTIIFRHPHWVWLLWTQTQRPLLDNIQHPQEALIHVCGGIRTRNPSKRKVADQF
jgi:hypothetical protein